MHSQLEQMSRDYAQTHQALFGVEARPVSEPGQVFEALTSGWMVHFCSLDEEGRMEQFVLEKLVDGMVVSFDPAATENENRLGLEVAFLEERLQSGNALALVLQV